MTTNLTEIMSAAAEQRVALIEQMKQAIAGAVTEEKFYGPTDDFSAFLNKIQPSLDGLSIVDIAPFIKPFAEETENDDLRAEVLAILQAKLALPTDSVSENVMNHLAMASILEDTDILRTRQLNAAAYQLLKAIPADDVDGMIEVFTDIQTYYPQNPAIDDRLSLSSLQIEKLEPILIAHVQSFLNADQTDPQTAERLFDLTSNLADYDVSCDLAVALVDHLPLQAQADYIEALADLVRQHDSPEDDVENPILARYGKTNGELLQALDTVGGAAQLLKQSPHHGAGSRTLDIS